MKIRLIILSSLLGLFLSQALVIKAGGIRAENLRVEYRTNPLGLDVRIPRLSWILASDEYEQIQTAYRILVASSPEILEGNRGDLWDSKQVRSDQTIQIPYGGLPLSSRTKA